MSQESDSGRNSSTFFSMIKKKKKKTRPLHSLPHSMRTFLAILLLVSVISCFQLEPTYTLTPKHIVFGVFVAGSSHTTWVLRFLDELAARGHQVTFLTLVNIPLPHKEVTDVIL